MKRILALIGVLCLAVFATGLQAQTGSDSKADNKFIEKALVGNMFEIEIGKIAAQKATNPEVKGFGQKMVDDHGKANDELKKIAESKNIMIPNKLDKEHQEKLDKASKLSGSDFDKKYMKMMVKGHKRVASEYKKEAEKGKDPQTKDYASKTLPIVQEHLKMAQDIEGKLK
jgi:putative membrane protein